MAATNTNNATLYEVLRNLTHDGKEYDAGSTVSLTEEQACRLIELDPPVIQPTKVSKLL